MGVCSHIPPVVLAAFAIQSAFSADLPSGPVEDALPAMPAEPLPGDWRFRDELIRPVADGFDVRPLYAERAPWLSNRISRCFFTPTKRPPLNRDELMDDIDYYPDAYLDRLAREGVNGLWVSVAFRDLAKTSFTERPATASRRLGKLRRTAEKCARHGIRLWLFTIEPIELDVRNDPLALAHPDWIGCTYDDRMGTMCASHPEVQLYVEESVRDIFSQVPNLGGIINISHGERVTSCLSLTSGGTRKWFTCPRCRNVPLDELHHRVTRAMARGMKSVNPAAEVISWIYRAAPQPELAPWIYTSARTQPDGVVQMDNFESGVMLNQEGRWHIGGDYWISCPGPSPSFSTCAREACAGGRRMGAKIQLSCSHEIASIPVLPVPAHAYRKYRAMRELGVTDTMLSWFFGSAPGLMSRAGGLLACSGFTEAESEFLVRLARLEGFGEQAERMAGVWAKCSAAFADYPLSIYVQYYGPYHQGVAWPLRPDIEMRPLGDSWVANQPAAGDLIGECLVDFELREAVSLSEKMRAKLADVDDDLSALERATPKTAERRRDLSNVRAFRNHLIAGRDVFRFYYLRREAVCSSRRGDSAAALRAIGEMEEIVRREMTVAADMKALCLEDPMLGFHSEAESYIYHPALFDWRQKTLDAAQARLGEIAGEVRAGRGYPLSALERTAPVFPAGRTADGGLVLEGEAKGQGAVSVYLYDVCGTAPARSYVVEPKDGRFRLVVPSIDWQDDPRLFPGWIQIHQGCSHLGDSWQYPVHPAFKWRWRQRDLLGFYSARIVVREK